MAQLSVESQILDSCFLFAVMTECFDVVPVTPLEVPVSVLGCWLSGGLCKPVINWPRRSSGDPF